MFKKAVKYALEDDWRAIGVDDFLEGMVQKMESANYSSMMKLTNPYIPIMSRPKNWKILAADLTDSIKKPENL